MIDEVESWDRYDPKKEIQRAYMRGVLCRLVDYTNVKVKETGNLGSNESPWITSRDDRAALTRSSTENDTLAHPRKSGRATKFRIHNVDLVPSTTHISCIRSDQDGYW